MIIFVHSSMAQSLVVGKTSYHYLEVAVYIVSVVRKWDRVNAGAQLSFSPLVFNQGSHIMEQYHKGGSFYLS